MIRWAVSRPAVVLSAALVLLLGGGVSFTRLALATRTSVELPRLQVVAAWPGASAELMETYITSPIEAAIQGVRGVKRTSSTSRDESMQLTVELEPTTDVQIARLSILERLELLRTEFPPGTQAPVVSNYVPQELEEEPLVRFTISGPYTAGTLQKIAEDLIQPRVSAVPGVSGISVQGGTELGVAVTYDARLLRQLEISPDVLAAALRDARVVRALGNERFGSAERQVVLRDQPGAIEELATLPVRGPAGRVFRLGELASVRPEEDMRGRFFRIDGQPAIALSASRHAGADAIKTAAAIRAALDAVKPTLPTGVRIGVAGDESEELERDIKDLVLRGLIAFAAVLLVLAGAMRNAKAVALVMASAAVSIAGTALGLYVLGIPTNLLTLAGLGMGVGILVQDGLIVVNRLGTVPDTAADRAEAAMRITPAVLGATATTAVVLFPFLYLQGDARAAFVPFAAAFVLALGWSVVAALVMIPALGKGHGVHETRWPRLRRVYARGTIALVRRRGITLGATIVVLAALGWGFVKRVPRLSFGAYGGEQRTTLRVSLGFPRGSDPATLDQAMREFERLAVGRPEVERVITQSNGTFGAGMSVLFTRAGGATAVPLAMQEEMTARAVFVGGASINVQGQGPGFQGGSGNVATSSFRIRLLGYSYAGVERLAKDLQARLERIARVRNVNINAASFFGGDRAYAVTLEPDRAALARYGVTAEQFRTAVAREMRGQVGRQLLEIGGDEIPVNVKAVGARDRSLDELRDALVPTPTGAPIRVGDLATVSEREALSSISREDQQYVRLVSYEFRGPQKLAQRTHDAFLKSIAVPAGYSVADAGFFFGFGGPDNSERGLWLVFAIGLALVLLTVALVFDSVWAAGMVFLSVPLAIAGVAAAFWIAKAPFTREAAVGVILVVGLAVHQAILLVDAALHRRRANEQRGMPGALSGAQAVHAALDRSGMILLVTLASLASLLPLAIGTDTNSLFGAIALATAGGTVAGTIGAMIVMPAMLPGRRQRNG
jgi:hydrophobic/amphiphilic exporter-1 (mainly G- bacteria), HAE1 family